MNQPGAQGVLMAAQTYAFVDHVAEMNQYLSKRKPVTLNIKTR
jgi:hypothetical protein